MDLNNRDGDGDGDRYENINSGTNDNYNLYQGPKLQIPSNQHLATIYNLLQHDIILEYQQTLMNKESNKKKFNKYAKLMNFLINCSYHFTLFPSDSKIILASICKRYYTFTSKNYLYVLVQENNSENVILYEIKPDVNESINKYSIYNKNTFCARDISVGPPNFIRKNNIKIQDEEIINEDETFNDIVNISIEYNNLNNIDYYIEIYSAQWKLAVILFNDKITRDKFLQLLNTSS